MAAVGGDIHRAIECRPDNGTADGRGWVHAVDLDLLYQAREYDAFGCLFGVMNFAGFEPVAAGRGFPADVTARARQQSLGLVPAVFAHSWISWAEIEAINWDQPAARPDHRLREYVMDEHGRWHLTGKGAHRRDFPAQLGLSPEDVEAHGWPPIRNGGWATSCTAPRR